MRVRRYLLLTLALISWSIVSCSRPDADTAVQVEAWLESLDPNAKVIEVTCSADIEKPPGSGNWIKDSFPNAFDVREVLQYASGRDWPDTIKEMVQLSKELFPQWWLDAQMGPKPLPKDIKEKLLSTFKYKNLKCEGKALRSPPIQIPKCMNDTNGCDEPPSPSDQPPPPPPPPGGGGDF